MPNAFSTVRLALKSLKEKILSLSCLVLVWKGFHYMPLQLESIVCHKYVRQDSVTPRNMFIRW